MIEKGFFINENAYYDEIYSTHPSKITLSLSSLSLENIPMDIASIKLSPRSEVVFKKQGITLSDIAPKSKEQFIKAYPSLPDQVINSKKRRHDKRIQNLIDTLLQVYEQETDPLPPSTPIQSFARVEANRLKIDEERLREIQTSHQIELEIQTEIKKEQEESIREAQIKIQEKDMKRKKQTQEAKKKLLSEIEEKKQRNDQKHKMVEVYFTQLETEKKRALIQHIETEEEKLQRRKAELELERSEREEEEKDKREERAFLIERQKRITEYQAEVERQRLKELKEKEEELIRERAKVEKEKQEAMKQQAIAKKEMQEAVEKYKRTGKWVAPKFLQNQSRAASLIGAGCEQFARFGRSRRLIRRMSVVAANADGAEETRSSPDKRADKDGFEGKGRVERWKNIDDEAVKEEKKLLEKEEKSKAEEIECSSTIPSETDEENTYLTQNVTQPEEENGKKKETSDAEKSSEAMANKAKRKMSKLSTRSLSSNSLNLLSTPRTTLGSLSPRLMPLSSTSSTSSTSSPSSLSSSFSSDSSSSSASPAVAFLSSSYPSRTPLSHLSSSASLTPQPHSSSLHLKKLDVNPVHHNPLVRSHSSLSHCSHWREVLKAPQQLTPRFSPLH
ncbi:uncharacterized protein MONOS_9014 [Monocercomonoides exilis]|uniref:uncharacterized protein n=1 Tax=Monocercomonoides exilis TaxID=2049356 RepID=UPI00355A03FA|nr:hypothetical protein MONOS_9014 [Monocercomonoides exilis]|eukprot:MONOS_9014.1-p1 / transcript=MONOS_9014.1 / gene=MONOS_9014 / organism=Monocercomonoides_exilis_PA203 / gene_product=unspecified product / transcript_product=unspecified product / location=Mono_scaffold00357:44256-46358(+) / protein_length=618 / sequence_SO=supercontig / SO=protein_coding / is_pseudo=false